MNIYTKYALSISFILFLPSILFGQEIVINPNSVPVVMDVSLDEKHMLARNGYWDLEHGKIIKPYADEKFSAAFTPDQKSIVAFYKDTAEQAPIQILNRYTWEVEREFDRPLFSVHHFRFSANGKYLISVHYDSLRVWNMETGRAIASHKYLLNNYWDIGRNIQILGDSVVVFAHTSDIVVWNYQTGTTRRLRHYGSPIFSLTMNTDSTQLLSASRGGLKLWNLQKGLIEQDFFKKSKKSRDLLYACFSPDNKHIVSCSKKEIEILNVKKGKVIKELPFYDAIYVCFSKDETQLYCLSEGALANYNLETGKQIWIESYQVEKYAITQGRLYAVGYHYNDYNNLRLLNLNKAEFFKPIYFHSGNGSYRITPAFSYNGQYLYGSNTMNLRSLEIVRCGGNSYPVYCTSKRSLSIFVADKKRPPSYPYLFNPIYPKKPKSPTIYNQNTKKIIQKGTAYYDDYILAKDSLHGVRFIEFKKQTYFQVNNIESLTIKEQFPIKVQNVLWCYFVGNKDLLFANADSTRSKVFINTINLASKSWRVLDTTTFLNVAPVTISNDGSHLAIKTKHLEVRKLPEYALIYKADSSFCSDARFSRYNQYFVYFDEGITTMVDLDKRSVSWTMGQYDKIPIDYYKKNSEYLNVRTARFEFTPDEQYLSYHGSILYESKSGEQIYRTTYFREGEFLIQRNNGQYYATPNAAKHFHCVQGIEIKHIDYHKDPNYNPKLLADIYKHKDPFTIRKSTDSCYHKPEYNKQDILIEACNINSYFIHNLGRYWDLRAIEIREGNYLEEHEHVLFTDRLIEQIYSSLKHPEKIIALYFYSTRLDVIDSFIKNFPNLEEIYISYELEYFDWKPCKCKTLSFSSDTYMLPNLKSLSIYHDCLTDIEIDITDFPLIEEVIINAPRLKQKPKTIGFELKSYNDPYEKTLRYSYRRKD